MLSLIWILNRNDNLSLHICQQFKYKLSGDTIVAFEEDYIKIDPEKKKIVERRRGAKEKRTYSLCQFYDDCLIVRRQHVTDLFRFYRRISDVQFVDINELLQSEGIKVKR